MEITRTVDGPFLDVALDGRLDGYWSDHLERVLGEELANGHHRIRLDCAKLTFLSSAGLGVLVKMHRRLAKINGSFQVVNPSKPVRTVLEITQLSQLLAEPARVETMKIRPVMDRQIERAGAGFDVIGLDAGATLDCRAVGDARALGTGAFGDATFSLAPLAPTFAIGVGALGDSADDCRSRFGELLTVANATAYQPGDGTNVPDYLVAKGQMTSDVHVLYGLACKGSFSHLIRFEMRQPGTSIGLAPLLETCLEAAGTTAIGVVIVAEAAGLVGATLLRSPVVPADDFFAHPGIRTRLAFTTAPAFTRGVALAAGVVARRTDAGTTGAADGTQLRSFGDACRAHLHAAAFRFRPIRKGPIDFTETVVGLFEGEPLLGVLHLLHDDRGATGAGDSELVRGACWIAPLKEGWTA